MLSIVIPTLNEEISLSLLLESIKKQGIDDCEIIVADAGSIDKTIEVAGNYGCKIISGGNPPKGKNEGAKVATGDLVLFIDADVILPEGFLNKNLKEFRKRNLDTASFLLGTKNWFHNLSFRALFNFSSLISERVLPQAMSIILVKKRIHQEIGGFDEKIILGEDINYIRRGARFGEFGVLKSVKAIVSPRRFEQDGWLKTWMKYFLCQICIIFNRPIKSNVFNYKFNHYSDRLKNPKNIS